VLITDYQKLCTIVDFCISSYDSPSAEIIKYAGQLLHNVAILLPKKNENQMLLPKLQAAIKASYTVMTNCSKEPGLGDGNDDLVLCALLEAECRLLYQNKSLTKMCQ
jgi:hypothetical protein